MSTPILFNTIERMVLQAAEGVRAPERLTVSQAAEKYRYVNNPGSFVGAWSNDMTPYLVEPMDMLQSMEHRGLIFVGPAQSGKTDMFLNWQTYTVKCDPADMMLINTTNTTARDFSIRRVDRLHRHTKVVGERLLPGANSDNTFDKRYDNGMIMNLSWPSINELSGRPIPRLWLTDYDRMEQDVDGEGTPFALAEARATSFRSHGMVAAESSPGFPLTDPLWTPSSKHEAPACEGILALYNMGDRRRWYWPCQSCSFPFEPSWDLITYPDGEDPMYRAEQAVMNCPHCGQIYQHDDSEVPGKFEMNQLGRWLRDGEEWGVYDDDVRGNPIRSKYVSYWLQGVAATFNTWSDLVLAYLQAEQDYERTGEEKTLKTVVNTKLGLPHKPKAQENARAPESLKARAQEYGHQVVPHGVNFLVATIDVQKNRFVVQVHGLGQDKEIWIVDRFEIKWSRRYQEDKPDQLHYVNPATHLEDWYQLVDEVLLKTYPLSDKPEAHMAIKAVFSDSGGKEGVTTNAYNFWRWLRDGHHEEAHDDFKDQYPWTGGLTSRFRLVKGASTPDHPRIKLTFPDSQRKDRHAGARGEIPVLMMNTTTMKNDLDNMLGRTDPGGGRVNFPKWLDLNFYKELCVEVKNEKGKWENPHGYRNESWDLLAYLLAGLLDPFVLYEHIDWSKPPTWAAEWDENDLVFYPEESDTLPFENVKKSAYDLAALADQLA